MPDIASLLHSLAIPLFPESTASTDALRQCRSYRKSTESSCTWQFSETASRDLHEIYDKADGRRDDHNEGVDFDVIGQGPLDAEID